jgi:hypothetical protein
MLDGYMLKLNKMQMQVLDCMHKREKDITICATGTGSGQSYIVEILPVLLRTDVVVLSKFRKDIKAVYNQLSEVGVKCSISFLKNRIDVDGNSITFTSSVKDLLNTSSDTLLVVEHIEHFSEEDSFALKYLENINKMLILTQPIHCGWREPKYEYGFLQRDEHTSDMVIEKASWDNHLINWKGDELRAKISDYRRGVNIITNYEVSDNPYFIESYDYIKTLNRLTLKDYIKLQGRWMS